MCVITNLVRLMNSCIISACVYSEHLTRLPAINIAMKSVSPFATTFIFSIHRSTKLFSNQNRLMGQKRLEDVALVMGGCCKDGNIVVFGKILLNLAMCMMYFQFYKEMVVRYFPHLRFC